MRDKWQQDKQAVKVLDVAVTPDFECVVCEAKNGQSFDVNFIGTNLEGVLDDVSTEVKPGAWAELGVKSDRQMYVLVLYTRDEFDTLPQHVAYRKAVTPEKYEAWRELHRVVPSLCPDGVALYYGRRPFVV